ncbi:MAG: type II toxin-antitoxin system VapC family toxin, partial [Nitrospira sp.]|nr:type II toxin-antitoxin system VapC family toxin [Nitrospira sp.]
MTTEISNMKIWVLDSSVFIHFMIIEHFHVLVRCRSPLHLPEYVYRVELTGPKCQDATRAQAHAAVSAGDVRLQSLSIADLMRMASLGPGRKAAVGEIACALIAERCGGGMLTDDRKARRWLDVRVRVSTWQSTEDVLIEAAHRLEVTEHELSS